MATTLHLAIVLWMTIPFPYFMTAGANIFTVPKLRDNGAMLGQLSFMSGMLSFVSPAPTVLGKVSDLSGCAFAPHIATLTVNCLRHLPTWMTRGTAAPTGTLVERAEDVAAAFPEEEAVQQMVAFLREGGDRAICTPREGKDETA